MSKIIKPYNLLDAKTHVAYTKYKKEGKIPAKHAASDRKELRKILKTISKHMAEGVVECPGGVHLKGIGYFFNWKCPRKMTYHIKKEGEGLEEHFNHHTGHYMFLPTFVPMAGKLDLISSWTMDKTFNQNVKDKVRDKLKKGFRYNNYLHSLKRK